MTTAFRNRGPTIEETSGQLAVVPRRLTAHRSGDIVVNHRGSRLKLAGGPAVSRCHKKKIAMPAANGILVSIPGEAAVVRAKRRLVAVLAADVVGYARLTEEHEENTHHWLMRLRREVLDKGIAEYGGALIKNTGDGFLAMFDSAGEATRCALSLQRSVALLTAEQRVDQRVSFRMAVNIAEAIIEKDDIYGDGVNVAARLQAYAEAGGVVVSGTVLEQVGTDINVVATDLGELQLRNLARPVRAYALCVREAPARLLGDSKAGVEARPSIAVLPFRKYQTDSADEYFADGIVDDIVHALGGLSELFVISRGSTLSYGGSAIDTRAIGRELGVRYVLYGSVQRSGNRLRIGSELSDTETGSIIHSGRHEGELADLFTLQDQISASVVKTIAPHVRDRELQRTMRKHPQSMTAYDFMLQALDVLYRMDHASFGRARGLLQQAIAYDPEYAPAYAYSAYWYVFRAGEFGSQESRADTEAAARYAAAAIERDSNNALALAISGHVQSFFLKNFPVALALLEKAIAAGPNLPIAWAMSSATHGYIADGATAVRHAEQAVRRSPLDALLFWHEGLLAQAHYVNGDYQEALRWARVAVARNDSIRFNLRNLIAILAALGEIDDARTVAQHLLQLQPDFRIGQYAARTPFHGPQLERRLAHLRLAELPE